MNQDRIWFLLARQLSGEASPAEAGELQQLLSQHPDKQYLADIISTYFKSAAPEKDPENSDLDLNRRLNRIIEDHTQDRPENASPVIQSEPLFIKRKTAFRPGRWLPYAAVVFMMGFTFWMVRHSSKPVLAEKSPVMQTSEVTARPGARTKLVLPDGSQVWLNSGSRLHYKNDFNTRLREVELDGEAFFEVAKNADHPFIVHTSAINVKVLGTAFNVKSYPKESIIETTLLRGMVEVTRKDDPSAPKVILRPNEKLVFHKNTVPEHPVSGIAGHAAKLPETMSDISIIPLRRNIPDSDKVETSWMYNKLVFDGDSFEELAAKMERWYNIKIVFKNERLLKYRFKGVFSNETVQDALNALRLTARFTYSIKDNEIELYKE
jgi:ferric-dicitrate binding protein FerR (iron transport regulator)